jgi:SAM-dependent methyltransferase
MIRKRSIFQSILDALTFPIRAISIFEDDRWGLSSLRSDRFYYCASQVEGTCLDVGCGRNNIFINHFLGGKGIGIDVYPYEGIPAENIIPDLSTFPFEDGQFGTITFIANLNHIPEPDRDGELKEAYRCLEPGGRIIVTMAAPWAEVLVHQVVEVYDRVFGTNHDMDNERGMEEEEEYYITTKEIKERLVRAGFTALHRKRFWTQWGLNSMFIAYKPAGK